MGLLLLNSNFSFRRFFVNCIFLMVIVRNDVISEDMFTSVSDMETMLNAEMVLIENIQNYIVTAESKVKLLKRYLNDHKKEYLKLSSEIDFAHPLRNSVRLYKHLKKYLDDRNTVGELLDVNAGLEILTNITEIQLQLKFPTLADLNGAVLGLLRIQNTYNVSAYYLSKGILSNGEKFSSALRYTDCFEIGRQLHLAEKFSEAGEWFEVSLLRFDETINPIGSNYIKRTKIFEFLSWSNYKQKKYKKAIDFAEEILKVQPNLKRIQNNLIFFKKEYKEHIKRFTNAPRIDDTENMNEDKIEVYRLYKKGCRNELKRSPKLLSKLHCRYLIETHNFLRYARVKLEEISYNPDIVLFHDVIYDSEIIELKNFVKGKMERAKVWDTNTQKEFVVDYRTNKLAWLDNETHSLVSTLKARVADLTGLSMATGEQVQIANYGIGGHFEPHHDYHYETENTKEEIIFPGYQWGNRIATLLFYMSDVLRGGSTVFPLLNITIVPKKASALFWFNLHANGKGDYRTFHAACPVVEGDKWIANQWIHERGQEFNRPCEVYSGDV